MLLSLSLLTLLTACDPSDNSAAQTIRADTPYVPQRYQVCFQKLTGIPPGGLTLAQAGDLLAKLRASEIEKQRCGRDLITWSNKVLKTVRGR